jgi:hypothetical protein
MGARHETHVGGSRDGGAMNNTLEAVSVVELLRELSVRHRMGYSERFEADADAFYAETHLIAPGRSIPIAMNAGDAYERERQEKWDVWTKARSDAWMAAIDQAAARIEWLEEQLGLVYDHVTHGLLSKPYAFKSVESTIDDRITEHVNEAVKEELASTNVHLLAFDVVQRHAE